MYGQRELPAGARAKGEEGVSAVVCFHFRHLRALTGRPHSNGGGPF